jgi:hypothetical protein
MGWASSTYGEERGECRVLVGNLRERDHLENRNLDGRIILKWIFKKWDGGAWTGLIWLRRGTGARLL